MTMYKYFAYGKHISPVYRWLMALCLAGLVVLGSYTIFYVFHRPLIQNTNSHSNPNITKLITQAVKTDPEDTSLILLRVVTTDTEREWGLSGFTELPMNAGMLFVFEKEGFYPFWMKDMLISLDMIWLDNDYRIIDIYTNIAPDTYPALFVSKTAARYVIELPAGSVAGHGIHLGQILRPFPYSESL